LRRHIARDGTPIGSSRRRPIGFTLIEMLAVMLVLSLLLGVALDFYVDLTRQATRATELTRAVRRANAILDRVASDLEHTLLVSKPAEADPLTHPWIFLAEPRHAENGSDRLKFVRRTTPRSTAEPTSPVSLVAYSLRRSEDTDEGFTLRRWSSSELPEGLDREFPLEGDPAELLLADGIEFFALRFLDAANGEWVTRWDSSLLEQSSRLPLAVEIELGMADPLAAGDDETAFGEEPTRHTRRVRLPVRPLDLETLFDPSNGEEDVDSAEDEIDPDVTVGDCLEPDDVEDIAEALGVSVDEAEVYYARNVDVPWVEAVAQAPALEDYGFCP